MPKRLEVIVVDDQRDLAETTGKLLSLYGHHVTVFTSAPAVLEALDNMQPDVILSDIRMPGMDGCELAALVRQWPGTEHIILAALTGLEDDESRQAAVAAGFDYRFVKPMRPDDLQQFLEEIAKQLH